MAQPAPALTVAVTVRNRVTTVGRQLDALAAQRWDEPWEVLVVDHGSTDGTDEVLARAAAADPRVRVARLDAPPGVGTARNAALRLAGAPAVAFADSDDEVAPGWVATMGEALRHHPLVVSRLEHRSASGEARPGRQADGVATIFGGLPSAVGAGMGVQRELWERLGGFSPTRAEDADFSIRAWLRLGVVPVFCGDARYVYRHRAHPRGAFGIGRTQGREQVELYRRYCAPQQREGQLRRALRAWAAVVATAPRAARRPGERARWATALGTRVGRLEESLRSRTFFP